MYRGLNVFVVAGGMLVLVALLIVFGPIITIWSVNTLFQTNIPVNIWTYLAALWIEMHFTNINPRRKAQD